MAFDLASIVTGSKVKPPKIVLYGVGGIGKTTFAACAPKPIVIPTEDGIGSLDVARFPLCRSWEDVINALRTLYAEDHEYQTVVLDSIDFTEPLLWRHTAQKHGKENIEDFGYGKGFVYALDEARSLMNALDYLRDEKGMNVIVIGHAEIKRFESPEQESFDRYKLKLQDRLAHFVADWCDTLLFANYKTHIVKDKEGFNKERKRAVGIGERILYTAERPAFWAKNRFAMPPEMEFTWEACASFFNPTSSQEN